MYLFTEKQARALVKLDNKQAKACGESSDRVARQSRVNGQWFVWSRDSMHYVEYDERYIGNILADNT